MLDNLPPCPFCENKIVSILFDDLTDIQTSYYVHCPRCGMHGPARTTREMAIIAYTKRISNESLIARIKELKTSRQSPFLEISLKQITDNCKSIISIRDMEIASEVLGYLNIRLRKNLDT